MEQLTETKEDIVLKNFENETGVDLKVYRRAELIEVIADLLSFPIYAGKYLIIPLVGFLLLTFVLSVIVFFLDPTYVLTIIAVVLIPLVSVFNSITTASLFFLFRLRDDMTKAISAGLDLTKEVAADIKKVYEKKDLKTLRFPGFGLIFQSVMYGIVIPVIGVVLDSKIPLIGGLFSGLIRRLADLTIGRTVKELDLKENDELPEDASPEEKKKWLVKQSERVAKISDKARGVIAGSIRWASLILLLPVTLVFGMVLAISSALYYLIFRALPPVL